MRAMLAQVTPVPAAAPTQPSIPVTLEQLQKNPTLISSMSGEDAKALLVTATTRSDSKVTWLGNIPTDVVGFFNSQGGSVTCQRVNLLKTGLSSVVAPMLTSVGGKNTMALSGLGLSILFIGCN